MTVPHLAMAKKYGCQRSGLFYYLLSMGVCMWRDWVCFLVGVWCDERRKAGIILKLDLQLNSTCLLLS